MDPPQDKQLKENLIKEATPKKKESDVPSCCQFCCCCCLIIARILA